MYAVFGKPVKPKGERAGSFKIVAKLGTAADNAPHLGSRAKLFSTQGESDRMFSLDASDKEAIKDHFRRNKAFSWSEEFFLSAINTAKSKYDVYWAVIALRDYGTRKSLPALKALSKYPMQDVKACAVLTIAQIAGAAETPYFVQVLEYPLSGRNKVYALWAIGVAGDERALESVERYVRKNKKKLQAEGMDPRAQQEVLTFLYRVDASSLLQEFSFLIPPLNFLTPFALSNFVRRVPGMKLSIEAVLGRVIPVEIHTNDSSVAQASPGAALAAKP